MQKKQQLVSERKRQTQRRGGGGGGGVSEKRDAMLSPFPSFLNTAQSSGSGEQSERCGTYPYSKSPDGADLNQPPRPPRYKYSGKPADTGNNKQRHMLRSTSVGRRHSSCLRASHFSSEFIHEGAPFGARHNTGKPELAGVRGDVPGSLAALFGRLFCCGETIIRLVMEGPCSPGSNVKFIAASCLQIYHGQVTTCNQSRMSGVVPSPPPPNPPLLVVLARVSVTA